MGSGMSIMYVMALTFATELTGKDKVRCEYQSHTSQGWTHSASQLDYKPPLFFLMRDTKMSTRETGEERARELLY